MKKLYTLIIASLLFININAQNVFTEGFDNVDSLINQAGWTQVNNSNPVGIEIWQNGDGNGLGIPAQNGGTLSFAESSYQAVAAASTGTISNWLITPTINLDNGMVVTFYASSYNNLTYPDRLELRLNPLNTVDVGVTETSFGDFTDTLLTINPNLMADSTLFPQNYWGQFAATISGLSAPTNCKMAFRYFVTDGGETGANSSTIGIDAFSVDMSVGIAKLKASQLDLVVYPNPVSDRLTLDFNSPLNENTKVNILNALGKTVISFVAQRGQLKASFSTDNLPAGSYTVVLNSEDHVSRKVFIKN